MNLILFLSFPLSTHHVLMIYPCSAMPLCFSVLHSTHLLHFTCLHRGFLFLPLPQTICGEPAHTCSLIDLEELHVRERHCWDTNTPTHFTDWLWPGCFAVWMPPTVLLQKHANFLFPQIHPTLALSNFSISTSHCVSSDTEFLIHFEFLSFLRSLSISPHASLARWVSLFHKLTVYILCPSFSIWLSFVIYIDVW